MSDLAYEADGPIAPGPRNVQRHPLPRRISHWIGAAAMLVMIGSGWRMVPIA